MLQCTRRLLRRLWPAAGLALALSAQPGVAGAQGLAPVAAQAGDDTVLQAREALRRKDKASLAAARVAIGTSSHPLAQWVEYWELASRLDEARQAELEAFYARWPGSYVEDRLRNDWLLELGRRRDWAAVRLEFPRFRMSDDREVACYALIAQHLEGQEVRVAARAAWLAQREPDDGCALLARTLSEAQAWGSDEVWQAARQAIEFNRPRLAHSAGALLGSAVGQAVGELIDKPQAYLAAHPRPRAGTAQELALLALMRLAGNDPEYAAGQLEAAWAQRLPTPLLATAWAHAGKQAALKLLPRAAEFSARAWALWDQAGRVGAGAVERPPWSDDLLAWQVRAALRQPAGERQRWVLALRAIDAMSPAEHREASWMYWRARALQGQADPGAAGDGGRALARLTLEALAGQPNFYGQLAAEDLGRGLVLPPLPAPPTVAENEAARARPGLLRALQLLALGLRSEGVREWNFSLRGLDDRELLAAAQWACERQVWDRCINTSERTRAELDIGQRFPTPLRELVTAQARATALDPAVLYGLIRQESRFVMDARSSAGAGGLMQIMPATARWTARKIGLEYRPELLTDRETNLLLGASYLKRVLDDFGGSLALAAAAYNAGPNRPRRWREGIEALEPAAWIESIPFNETRDYVKKVLSNSVVYAALLGAPAPTLKSRLGPAIGPREPGAAAPDRDLP
jgi:soluble lytic murein transglycosylase